MSRRIQNFPKTKHWFKSPKLHYKVLLLLMILIELYHKGINHYTMSCLLVIHFTIYLGVITLVPCLHCGKSLLWGPELRLKTKNATDPFRYQLVDKLMVKCVISLLLSRATGTSVNSMPLLALFIRKKISIHVSKCWGTLLQGTYLPEGEIPLDKVPSRYTQNFLLVIWDIQCNFGLNWQPICK
jgi:hypothetical protein